MIERFERDWESDVWRPLEREVLECPLAFADWRCTLFLDRRRNRHLAMAWTLEKQALDNFNVYNRYPWLVNPMFDATDRVRR